MQNQIKPFLQKGSKNGKKETWKHVPIQDFTNNSDIDWSKSIHEIDLQLYKKYGLDETEINFIENMKQLKIQLQDLV